MNDALYRFQHYFSHIKVTDQLLMYFLNVTSTWQIPSESLYWHSVASKVSVKESTYTDCLIFFFFFKSSVQAVDDIDRLCEFQDILTTNADCIALTRNAKCQLKMATFPLPIDHFFLFSKSIQFKL